MKKRIGVLLSGRGSNFEALAESVSAGRIPNAEIAVVISNREGAPGIERASTRGIKTCVIPSKGLEREVYDRQVAAILDEHKVDLICLAGYMRLLSPFFVAKYPNRILNIHPSLLPSFPGLESQPGPRIRRKIRWLHRPFRRRKPRRRPHHFAGHGPRPGPRHGSYALRKNSQRGTSCLFRSR